MSLSGAKAALLRGGYTCCEYANHPSAALVLHLLCRGIALFSSPCTSRGRAVQGPARRGRAMQGFVSFLLHPSVPSPGDPRIAKPVQIHAYQRHRIILQPRLVLYSRASLIQRQKLRSPPCRPPGHPSGCGTLPRPPSSHNRQASHPTQLVLRLSNNDVPRRVKFHFNRRLVRIPGYVSTRRVTSPIWVWAARRGAIWPGRAAPPPRVGTYWTWTS